MWTMLIWTISAQLITYRVEEYLEAEKCCIHFLKFISYEEGINITRIISKVMFYTVCVF